MSRRRRQGRKTRGGAGRPLDSRRLRLSALLAVGLVVAVVAAVSWWSASGSRTTASPPAPAEGAGPSAAAPSGSRPAAETPRHFLPLLGEWQRPDGGYVLSVQAVAPGGRATVQYFNPRPIRVARAAARQDGQVVGLFVEFDDVNYPGSTYTLAYDAASDQLQGVYFQATQRARYDVVFSRRR